MNATTFFERYDALPETERQGRIREIAEEVGVDWMDAFRWVHVERPRQEALGGEYPANPVPDEAPDPTPTSTRDRSGERLDDVAALISSQEFDLAQAGQTARNLQKAEQAARYDRRAVWLEDEQAYLVSVSPSKPPLKVPLATHERMLRAYSNWDGHPVRVEDIARSVGITPTEFRRYKSVFGWTRSAVPFDELKLARISTEEAVSQLAAMKETALAEAWQKKCAHDDALDAKKWREGPKALVEALRPALESALAVPFREAPNVQRGPRKRTLMVPLNDWQVGSFASAKQLRLGREFSREVFEAMIEDHVLQMTEYVNDVRADWQRPVVPLVGDLIHGLTGKTVHDTQLAKHMREFDWEQAQVCLDALYRICDAVLDLFGGFHAVSLPGNHEGPVAQVLAESLRQRYRAFDGVEVTIPHKRSHQMMIQGGYFTFDHGASPDSNVKGGKIARTGPKRDDQIKSLVMARPDLLAEAKARRGGVYFVMGDQHHSVDEGPTGVELIKLPALPSGDVYADENLWHSRPAQGLLLVGEHGLEHYHRLYFDNARVFAD